jgi:hypothetical protein
MATGCQVVAHQLREAGAASGARRDEGRKLPTSKGFSTFTTINIYFRRSCSYTPLPALLSED